MKAKYPEQIAAEFKNCVLKTIERLNNEDTNRPFHAALLSDVALFWSRFERSFSTSFGQRVIEEISRIVALAGGASEASRQKVTVVQFDSSFDKAITDHMIKLRKKNSSSPTWQETLAEI